MKTTVKTTISENEYESRRSRLLERMEAENLDAVVLYASKPESGYVRYYSGFESDLGILDCSFLVVTTARGGSWTLLTNAFWQEVPAFPRLTDFLVTSDFPGVLPTVLPAGARRIGMAPLRQFPADCYQAIRDACCVDTSCVDIKRQLLQLRAIKSPAEIEILQEIAGMADRGAEAFSRAAREGATELDIAAEVEYALRRAGSGPFIFSTLVCAGPRTGRFIALPGSRRAANGDIVQLDCGPSLDGYHGDFSRAICAGSPPEDAARLLNATAILYERCLSALAPGRAACDVAREVLKAAGELGYGPENFYRSPNVKPGFVGHGIGLGNPDWPQLSTEEPTVLEEGMVLTIETILRDSCCGSARTEDAVAIEKHGARRLSRSPVRLWEIGAGAAR